MNFQDKYGLYHHIPNPAPDSSSNAPVFTAAVLALKSLCNTKDKINARVAAENALKRFKSKGYYVNYASDFKEKLVPLSHDNWKGIVALSYLCGEKMHTKFQFRSHARPDNFCLWVYVFFDQRKLGFLTLPFLWVWMLASFFSMTRKFKTRNGVSTVRASNKQMVFFLCVAMRLKLTLEIATWLIERNSAFGSWHRVFERYYMEGHSPAPLHPTIAISKELRI